MPGYIQNLRNHRLEDEEEPLPNVVEVLLLQWSQGEMSAAAVQRVAQAMVLDGNRQEAVMELAALGSQGAYPGNISRDLKTKYAKQVKVAEAFNITVPVIDPRANPRQSLEPAGLLLPHDVVCSIGLHYPQHFHHIFGTHDLETFWSQVKEDDFHWGPDLHRTDIDPKFTIPMWLHGDGVAFGEKDSLMVLSFGSLTSSASSSSGCLFSAAFAKKVTLASPKDATADTWRNIWLPLAWSWEALIAGKHPERDHEGKPWQPGSRRASLAGKDLLPSGPWRCLLWTLVGDYEYMANTLKLPRWKSNALCGWCDADRSKPAKNPWKFDKPGWKCKGPNDFGDAPIWREIHPIFQIRGVHDLSVQLDVLHLLDLGTSQAFAGSIVKELLYYDMTDSVETNLGRFWERVWNEYNSTGATCRISNLTLGMVVNTGSPHADYPHLRLKAAETRHFIPVLSKICQGFLGSKQQRVRAEAAQALTQFYEQLEYCDYVPTTAQHLMLEKLWWNFLRKYQWLSEIASKKSLKLYDATPKFHYSSHLTAQSFYLNPRKTWTYKNEDFVGTVAAVAASCAFGTRAPALSLKVADKMRFYMHFLMSFQHED